MIIFAKRGEYERRQFIEKCFEKYIDTMAKTKLAGTPIVVSGANNKPYFKDYPNIRFSMSHSGDLVVLAMADTEVGIDIEQIAERDYLPIVERHFFEDEKKEITDLESFLKIWTKKEALLKLTAAGLGGLSSADVTKPVIFGGAEYEFTTLEIFDGFVGTVVAVPQPIIFVQID
jgi:Phosphopantetheinyl transferase